MERTTGWFAGIKAEWKKITWPTGKELTRKTLAVIATSAFLGAVLTILDFVFQNGVNLIAGAF